MPINREWLFKQIGQDAAVCERFVKPSPVQGQEDCIVEFQEKFIALMHITGR
jgi:hypothetical protein